MKRFLSLRFLTVCLTVLGLGTRPLAAQDEEQELLNQLTPVKSKVVGTFNAPYVVNTPTNEAAGKNEFIVNFSHRFGEINNSAPEENLAGLYEARDIRLALDYGITNRLSIGIAGNKIGARYEVNGRYKVMEQRVGGFPFSITAMANAVYSAQRNGPVPVAGIQVERYPNATSRLSYLYAAVLACKVTKHFSLSLVPTYLHRNYVVGLNEETEIFALGIGSRLQVSRTMAFTSDIYLNSKKYRSSAYFLPIGLGWEVVAGGHVFQILLTNAAVLPNEFLVNSSSDWAAGKMSMGFNLIRSIGVGKKRGGNAPTTPKE